MSPAAPSAPRCTWPPATKPDPMPVPIFTNSRKASSLQWAQCSPTAMMFTSLSTSAGTPNQSAKRSPTGCRFQPGMIGGNTGLPVANSTGPGRPTPTPRSSPTSRPALRRRSSKAPFSHGRTTSGPSATAMFSVSWASTPPARSVTATRVCVAPTSPASTTPTSLLNASIVGGRPPVDALSPPGMSRRWARSASTRWATVERDRPVKVARSPRVVARPLRTRSRIVPAVPVGPAVGRALSEPALTVTVNQRNFRLSKMQKTLCSARCATNLRLTVRQKLPMMRDVGEGSS